MSSSAASSPSSSVSSSSHEPPNGESIFFRKQQQHLDDESISRPRSISPIDLKHLNKLLKLSNPNLRKQTDTNTTNNNNKPSSPININSNEIPNSPGPVNGCQMEPISPPLIRTSDEYDLNDVDEEEVDHTTLIQNILTPTASPTLGVGVANDAKRIHRVVLTGGPCAGKTTSIERIKVFFENIGWRVFVVPETATLLLSSGIYFYELASHTLDFQESLLKTLLQIEDTINETVRFYNTEKNQNCIVIYDRGAMDPVAYLKPEDWEVLKSRNPAWNEVDLRDNRYDQIIHMVTAANGAERFYALDNNSTRTEGIEVACLLDKKTKNVWIGHPYIDVIDNSTNFEMKIARVLRAVCLRIGIQLEGCGNRKRKFLVRSIPESESFPAHQDFTVVHNYLVSVSDAIQARIRKRGQSNVWSYTYTVRIKSENEQTIETSKQIDKKEYTMLLKTADTQHYTIYKLRRCFEWNHHYYQLDMYEEPCKPRCRGLAILSTRSTETDLLLPDFLEIEREVTNDPAFSMFNLSSKKDS